MRVAKFLFSQIFVLFSVFIIVAPTGASEVTVHLEDINSATTAPPGNFRWLDIANQPFRQFVRENFDYTQADVTVTYEIVAGILQGTLTAFNLKPNFAYQLKLAGNPDIDADSNERIGLAGRWWQEYNGTGQNLNSKGDGSSPNPNDDIYFDTWDNPAYRYTGYMVFDYFITDENGAASFSFEANSSYHVLWATNDSDGNDGKGHRDRSANDGPLKESTFDADLSTVVLSDEAVSAYDDTGGDDFPPRTVAIFGEWERLPVGGVFPVIGDNFVAQLFLTEESFHGSGGQYAGGWAAAMSANISYSALIIEAEDATIKTVGGPTSDSWNLWSNGTVAEYVSIPEAGTYEMVVRAYGSPLDGIWPVMELSLNGLAGETVTVDSAEYTDYVFQVELIAGVHTIEVSFLNDAYDPPMEDRNLYLDKFTIISPPGIEKPEIVGAAGALVIEAENATIKTVGGPTSDGWNLWSNGTLGESVDIPEAGTYEVVVRAYGSPLGGIWPEMELSVDGVAEETVIVDSSKYTEYVFQLDLGAGIYAIGFSFLNDAWNPGAEDRNLYLDRFTIISPPGVIKPELAPL